MGEYYHFRFKNYTKEDLEGKELVELFLSLYRKTAEISPLKIAKFQDKQLVTVGGSRKRFADFGLLNYSTILLPKEDAEACLKEFKEQQIWHWEDKIKRVQEELEIIKNMTIKEEV
jgi:hypothetical protein